MKVKLLLIGIVVMLGGCDRYITQDMINTSKDICNNHDGINYIDILYIDTVRCNDGLRADIVKLKGIIK